MKKTLYLHIGVPKTGTTSIQNILHNNRSRLARHGITYPKTRVKNHSLNFLPIFKDKPAATVVFKDVEPESIPGRIEEFKKYWISEFKKLRTENFVISGEGIYNFKPSEISRIKEYVEPYFNRIRVIVYVRHPLDHIPSMVQQLVKMGKTVEDMDEFAQRICCRPPIPSLPAWIENFGKENILIRPFDRGEFRGGDLLVDFLAQIVPKPIELKDDVGVLNPSLGQNDVELLLEFNKVYPEVMDAKVNSPRTLKQQRRIMLQVLSKVEQGKFKINFHFDKETADIVNQNLSEINQVVSGGYQFPLVEADAEEFHCETFGSISVEYLIEVINAYNNFAEELKRYSLKKDDLKTRISEAQRR